MFHCVDTMPNGSTKLTCFKSRVHVATALVAALPSYLHFFYGEEAYTAWVPCGTVSDPKKYEFIFDDAGKWTGEWQCAEDAQFLRDLELDDDDCPPEELLSSNVRIIGNPEAVTTSIGSSTTNPFQRPVAMETENVDNATIGSFSSASGRKRSNREMHQDDATIVSNQDTIVSNSTAGTAVTAPAVPSGKTPMDMDLPSIGSDQDTVVSAITAPGASRAMTNPPDVPMEDDNEDDNSVVSDVTNMTMVTAPHAGGGNMSGSDDSTVRSFATAPNAPSDQASSSTDALDKSIDDSSTDTAHTINKSVPPGNFKTTGMDLDHESSNSAF
jgi:hypothetical protein